MSDNYVALRIKATDEARPDLADLKLKLDELKGRVSEARAEVSTAEADRQLADLDAKLDYVSKKVASPKIDVAGASRAAASITAVEADLDGLDAKAAESAAAQEASAGKSESAWAAAGEKMKLAFLGVGAGLAYGIVKAARFQQSMTLLHTQAGVTTATMNQMSAGVLDLAGQVGQGPDSLAEAAYHVASNMSSMGATSVQMLSAVRVAAEGARVGNANLVDVTNALGAAIASGMKGTQDYTQAMGVMNATVGAGDMKMQDLAEAFGGGNLATVKGYGATLSDVGAILATFGDNNLRGAGAGTEMRMAVQALAVQASSAKPALAELGLAAGQIGARLREHGAVSTLNMLNDRMKAAGLTAKTEGPVITELFGKKAGSGISVLLEQIDRVNSKMPELARGAKGFGAAWKATQQTTQQKLADLQAGSEALAIKLGTALLPAANAVIGSLSRFVNALERGKGAAVAMAGVVGSVLALMALKKLEDGLKGAVEGVEGLVKGTRKAIGAAQKLAAALNGSGKAAAAAAAEQEAASGEAAAAAETDAAATATANEEAAATSSGSWIKAAGRQVAAAAGAAAQSAARVAVVVASSVAGAATTAGAWIAAGAQQAAGAAVTAAQAVAKVAMIVASNVAGAAVTMAAWVAANAVMLLGIGLVIAAVVVAVIEIVKHWKQISHAAEVAFHAVLAVVDKVIGWVKQHWPLLLAILTGPFGLAVLAIRDHWKQVRHAVAEVIGWIRGHWPLLLAILTGPIGLAVLLIRDHWHQIVSGAQGAMHDITGFFGQLPGRILAIMDRLGTDLFSAGGRIIQFLAHGIMSGVGAVTHAVSSVIDEVKSFLPFSPAKKGPLSGSGAPENSGRSIARLLAQGITRGLPDVGRAMSGLTGSAGLSGRSLGPGGGGGSGGQLEVVLRYERSGEPVIDEIFEGMKVKVRSVGGGGPDSVQRALGRTW